MSSRSYIDFLDDIVSACRSIIRFVEGMTMDDYFSDEKTRFAVTHAYEIMGEAVKHLPEDLNPIIRKSRGREWLPCEIT